jgi:hypothetical protein
VRWHIQIRGGSAPYKITWDWGDGNRDDTSTQAAGAIDNSHSYQKSGIYRVVIRARDAAGRDAVISLLAIVNGPTVTGPVRPLEPPGNLVYIWPLLMMASLMVLSFWLGERHKLALVSKTLNNS